MKWIRCRDCTSVFAKHSNNTPDIEVWRFAELHGHIWPDVIKGYHHCCDEDSYVEIVGGKMNDKHARVIIGRNPTRKTWFK